MTECSMIRNFRLLALLSIVLVVSIFSDKGFSDKGFSDTALASEDKKLDKQEIKALYMPLADHYAAIVAFEKYRNKMEFADFKIEQMKNWDFLRSAFKSDYADMAFAMAPLAMDMFRQQPDFRWIGLMHRDGNSLAGNSIFWQHLIGKTGDYTFGDNNQIVEVLKNYRNKKGHAVEVGVPHLLSTHAVVLYRFLTEQGISFSPSPNGPAEVVIRTVAPAKSPTYLKAKANMSRVAAIEQSLPWSAVAVEQGVGNVIWYSKDIMPWHQGHVECIALAKDIAISNKKEAVAEVMKYIQIAGQDIEQARVKGGDDFDEIIGMIRKHIPLHGRRAIQKTLNPRLSVINYNYLNIDKEGLKQIMDFAVKGNILKAPIDIEEFSAEEFFVEIGSAKE